MRRLDCHARIKGVKSSYQTALQVVNLLTKIAARQPRYLFDHSLDMVELEALGQGLHDVYFVRMFASFESSLRDYWRASVRNSRPATEQLLGAIAGRRGVPQDTLDAVQEIREFRNCLIHEEHQVRRRFTIDEASKHLNTYLARLPLEW